MEDYAKTMLAIHLQIMHNVNCESSVDMKRKAEDEPTVGLLQTNQWVD